MSLWSLSDEQKGFLSSGSSFFSFFFLLFIPALLSSLHVRAFYTKPLSNMEMISCWKICSAGFLSLLATFAKCIFWSNLDLCMSFLKYAWYINILTVIYHNVWIHRSCSAHVLYSNIPRLTCQVPETTCSVVKIPVPSQAKLHKQWCLFDQVCFQYFRIVQSQNISSRLKVLVVVFCAKWLKKGI